MHLTDEAVRHQIDRLLQSKSLQGSEVQRRLLQYLAEKSLAGEGERLKEYTIALDALGKPATYDPRYESGVRIQIGRLRNKLTEYYHSEGSTDPILVSLPKGTFKVNFEEVQAAAPAGPAAWKRPFLVAAVVAAIALLWAGVASARLLRLQRQTATVAEAWNPELEEFWAPFLESQRPLLLCLGTPLFGSLPGQGFFRSPAANDWEELRRGKGFSLLADGLKVKGSMPWYAFTGVGEASAAFLLGKLLGTRRNDILITRSNLLSWQEISDMELVFLGPPKFNVQLAGMPARQDITVESNGLRIANPKPGEPEFLPDVFEPGPQFNGTTHALISRLPGLSGHGRLLVLAGNGSPDTMAAAQWLTQPSLATELARRIRLPNGKLPRHYQIVLKVQFRNGVPVGSSYLLHRVVSAE